MAEIDVLLKEMLEQGGSDLHLSVKAPPKIRVDGSVRSLDYEPFTKDLMEELLTEVVPESRWQQFLKTGDIDIAYEVEGSSRFRMNVYQNHWGPASVLRQIPMAIATIDDLGLPEILKKISFYNQGLVLVTGPTGSGKSTTLAAMVDYINRNCCKEIITLEDPVEFTHKDNKSTILHREITVDCRTYSDGLRSAMRADPDVILIGEMRDRETIQLALNCASMGMLVLGTLHTNSATKTIDRIIDMFPADEQSQVRIMLAESLQAIISQILCKQEDGGRIPAFEILTHHGSLPNCIRQNSLSSIRNIIDQNRENGMVSMDTYLQDLLNENLISREEAYMKALDKNRFRS